MASLVGQPEVLPLLAFRAGGVVSSHSCMCLPEEFVSIADKGGSEGRKPGSKSQVVVDEQFAKDFP
eukprot:9168811-Lingulodinium_polyedra.AAC.1